MSTSNFDPERRFRKRSGGPERGFKKHDDGVYWERNGYGGSTRREKKPGTFCDGVLERIYARRRNDKDKWQFYAIGDRCTKCGEMLLDDEEA